MRQNSKKSKVWRLGYFLCVLVGLSGCVTSDGGQGGVGGGQSGVSGSSQIEHRLVTFDISADGKDVVFSSADADLYLLNLNTLVVSQLTTTELLETAPVFSPDGKTVTYAAGTGGKSGFHIFTLSLLNKTVTQITTGATVSDHMPCYSEDGTRIVFARAHRIRPYSMGGWTADNYDAYIVRSNGGAPHRLTNQNYSRQNRPQLLGEEAIVYGAAEGYPDTTEYLFVDDISTGRAKDLTPQANGNTEYQVLGLQPDVSRDGKKIVFISDRVESFAYDLFLMNSDGTKQTPLNVTHISRYNQNPVFMPDGRSILFLASTSSNAGSRPIFSLWQVNIDGSNARQIAGSGLFTHPRIWKPGHEQGNMY